MNELSTTGRTTLVRCTSDVIDTIVAKLGKNMKRSTVAAYVGIAPQTLNNWLRRGEAGESPYYDLFVRVNQAEAMAAEKVIDVITEMAVHGKEELEPRDQQKAAFFLLDRVHGYTAKQEVVTDDKGATGGHTDYSRLTQEEMEVLEYLTKRLEVPAEDLAKLVRPQWLVLPVEVVAEEVAPPEAEEVVPVTPDP